MAEKQNRNPTEGTALPPPDQNLRNQLPVPIAPSNVTTLPIAPAIPVQLHRTNKVGSTLHSQPSGNKPAREKVLQNIAQNITEMQTANDGIPQVPTANMYDTSKADRNILMTVETAALRTVALPSVAVGRVQAVDTDVDNGNDAVNKEKYK